MHPATAKKITLVHHAIQNETQNNLITGGATTILSSSSIPQQKNIIILEWNFSFVGLFFSVIVGNIIIGVLGDANVYEDI